MESLLRSATTLVSSAKERSSIVKYGLNSLESNSFAVAAAARLSAVAKRVDEAVALSFAQASKVRAELATLQPSTELARARAVVGAEWFRRVDEAIAIKDRVFSAASTTYSELHGQSLESFLSALQTRMAHEWDSRLLGPATAFYATAQEKWADKSGKIDMNEVFADVRHSLGSAWETQVGAVHQHSLHLYNAAVEYLHSVRSTSVTDRATDLATHVRERLGAVYSSVPRELLQQWLEGAAAAAREDVQKLTCALDYNGDGRISASDALAAGHDLLTFLKSSALGVAERQVDYWLPSSSVEAVRTDIKGEAGEVKAEGVAPALPTVGALCHRTVTRVQARVTPLLQAARSRLGLSSTLAHQQYTDVLSYASSVLIQGQERAQSILNSTSSAPLLHAALQRGSHALSSVRARASAVVDAARAPGAEAVSILQQLIDVRAVEVPSTALHFIARSLGVQERDDAWHETVTNVLALIVALRDVVVVSSSAVIQPPTALVSSTLTSSHEALTNDGEHESLGEGQTEGEEVFYEAVPAPSVV